MNLFPTLPGLAFPVSKSPITSTRTLEASSGVEYRAQNWSAPRWKFSLPIEFLRQYASFTEWQTIVGFILQQAGMFANFLFKDTTDNTVIGQQIGVGNGVQTAFPLVRAIAGYIEPIYYCSALNAVYLSGMKQTSGFSLTQSGFYGPDTVTFSTPPGAGISVQANFQFYFVCRFLQDDPETTLFVGGRWDLKKLELRVVNEEREFWPEVASGEQPKLFDGRLWSFNLKNGVNLYYTSWNFDLTVSGITFKSHDVIIKGGKFKQVRGLEVNETDLTCYPSLGSQGNIPVSMVGGMAFLIAVRSGVLDRATVTRQRVFMPTPGDTSLGAITLFVGEVTDTDATRNMATLKCKDATNLLNIYMPRRQYQPTCSWTFGDSNCTINTAALTVNSAVGAGSNGTIIYAPLTQATGFFSYGKVVFTSGVNAGIARAIKTYSKGIITLTGPFPLQAAVGDTFAITPGCSKTLNGIFESFNGAVQSGLSPSVIYNNLGNAAGQFNGYTITFTSGVLTGMSSVISSWTPQLAILSTPFNQTPANGDIFELFAPGAVTPSAIGTANTIVSGSIIPISLPMADGFFNNGTLLFTSGANVGQSRTIINWQNGLAVLQSSFTYAPVIGDTCTLTTATTNTQATCTGYNNTINFGGEPYTPIPETAY